MCGKGGGLVGGLIGGIVGGLLGSKEPDGKAANDAAQKNADRAFQQQQEDSARMNAKQPNTQKLLDENVQAALGGSGSTMLTGSTGVDPASLLLGKNTLLGQ